MYRLMIVDNSMIMRNKIARMPRQDKFVVACKAENGLQAVEMCRKHMPDIVTMDLTMPQMDGLRCIEKLIEIKPDIQILVVSALSDKATGIRALELGANGFLNKPFTNEELYTALQDLVEESA